MENIKEGLDGFVLPASDGMRKYLGITEPVGQVGLTCVLYFRGGHLPEVQAKACECIREYVQILGKEARCCLTPAGRIVMAGEKGLPLMDVKQVSKRQEKDSITASYLVSSNATREEFKRQPPKCMLRIGLYLKKRNVLYSRKRARPDMPSDIPLDRQVSYIFASFAPSLFLVDEPPIPFADLVLKWCQRLRPVNGTAGWGVTRACDILYAESIRAFIAPDLLRFPGLDMPDTFFSEVFTEHIANINWLTMLNEELAARIGGPERLKALGEDFPIAEYPGGYVIQAGPRPELGDRNKGDIPRFYARVHELLRPLYPPLECMTYLTGAVLPPDAGPDFDPRVFGFAPEDQIYLHDFFRQWMHRFD